MAQLRTFVDKLLTTASNGYFPEEGQLLAENALPTIEVTSSSGKLTKYGLNHLRIVHTLMGGRAAARRVDPILKDVDTYYLDKHGLEGMVTEEDYDNFEEFDAENEETLALTHLIQLGKERAFLDVVFNSANITQGETLAGAAQFSDSTSSPLTKAQTAKSVIYDATGAVSNYVAITSQKVVDKLRYHPEFLDKLGFVGQRAGALTMQDLAVALEVDRVLVSSALYNSAAQGQNDALTPVAGKDILFAVLPTQAKPRQISLGYYVKKKGGSRRVSKYPMNNPSGATGILVDDFYDVLLSNAKAGYLIKNAIA